MDEVLQEYCDSRGVSLRVNGQSGILRGVKILGLESRNGRRYRTQALAEATQLYEGAKVNVNHPKTGPLAPRDYQERIGVIRNVTLRETEGLFGDLHFNPRHTLAEQLVWDAEHAPENVGFSHNVTAHTARGGKEVIVEAITKVHSVDLVADPATTRGLFESHGPAAEPVQSVPSDDSTSWDSLTAEGLKQRRPDVVETLLVEQSNEISRLQMEIDRCEVAEATERRRIRALALLREHNLPDPDSSDATELAIVGNRFLVELLATSSDAEMKNLVEQRAQLVKSVQRLGAARTAQAPVSRDQYAISGADHGVATAADFARAIT